MCTQCGTINYHSGTTVGADVPRQFGTSADMSYEQFFTGAEVSWVRTVLGHSEVSVHQMTTLTSQQRK